jgi:uncharacterized protein YbjT (DUF2867 family)
MTILVTGAHGNIGRRVIATLTAAGHDVRGSARDGTADVQLDITNPRDTTEALRDIDTMFLYPTRGDVDGFLAAARKVQHVVLLSPRIRENGRLGIAHPDAQVSPIHPDDIAEVAADLLTSDRTRSANGHSRTGPPSRAPGRSCPAAWATDVVSA